MATLSPLTTFPAAHNVSASSYPSIDLLSPEQISHGIDLFHSHVSAFVPFIHRPTFDPAQTPELVLLGILSISLRYSPNRAEGLDLAGKCFRRGRRILDVQDDNKASPLVTAQALALLQVHAIMFACGEDTTYGLRMRARGVEIARREGLMDPLPDRAGSAEDLGELWRCFVRGEVHKRSVQSSSSAKGAHRSLATIQCHRSMERCSAWPVLC